MASKLFRISFAVSLAGIFLLLLLSNIFEPKQIAIKDVSVKMLNQKVKVQGKIWQIEKKENFEILTLADSTGRIEVLCNCKSNKFTSNQTAVVTGLVGEYKKNLQITADKIIRINDNSVTGNSYKSNKSIQKRQNPEIEDIRLINYFLNCSLSS